MSWFEIDKDGLAQLVEMHGKHRLIMELIANAWDEPGIARVDVELRPQPSSPYVEVTVIDDAPGGFEDLSHAWRVFAPSKKKTQPNARGRFNLGEKLVLALCRHASITSTTGTVRFGVDGRTLSRTKIVRGTQFRGMMRMTQEELDTAMVELKRMIPPVGVETRVTEFQRHEHSTPARSYVLVSRAPLVLFHARLPTVVADDEGILRTTPNITPVRLYPVNRGEEDGDGWLFEMGVPVVVIGGPWHLNIFQKVPLNKDRDNVPPAYIRQLEVLALDAAHNALPEEELSAAWVSEALERAAPDTVSSVLDRRFGKKRVSYDPSDPEANKRAAAEGYTVVPGGALSGAAWANVRHAQAIKPAGQVTPSPKPKFSADGVDTEVPRLDWTTSQIVVAGAFKQIGEALLRERTGLSIHIVRDKWNRYSAWYGRGGFLTLNLNVLGHDWFDDATEGLQSKHLSLLLHELGHEFCDDHLSDDYHRALTRLGGALAFLMAEEPKIRRCLNRKATV